MDQDILLVVVGILALVLVLGILLYPRLKAKLTGPGVELSLEGSRDEPAQPKDHDARAEEKPEKPTAPAAPAARNTTIRITGDQKGQIVDTITSSGDVHVGNVHHGPKDREG